MFLKECHQFSFFGFEGVFNFRFFRGCFGGCERGEYGGEFVAFFSQTMCKKIAVAKVEADKGVCDDKFGFEVGEDFKVFGLFWHGVIHE